MSPAVGGFRVRDEEEVTWPTELVEKLPLACPAVLDQLVPVLVMDAVQRVPVAG